MGVFVGEFALIKQLQRNIEYTKQDDMLNIQSQIAISDKQCTIM